jgi:hypothetical protein
LDRTLADSLWEGQRRFLEALLSDRHVPDGSITQDSVMALGFAVANRHRAHAVTLGRINTELFYELNDLPGPPASWFDQQKLTSNGLSFGLVRVELENGSTTHYDPDDPADCRRVENLRGNAELAHARGASESVLDLEPFSDEWYAWYEERRTRSEIDLFNDNDARRGIIPPAERRARERAKRRSLPA